MTTYRDAAVALWGEAGAYVHDAYARWLHLYPELPDELPIVVGITAYGHCNGLTRGEWGHGPRITIFSSLFAQGQHRVADTIAHEMLHAWLVVTRQNIEHDSEDWYAAVRCLSPDVLGFELEVRRGQDRKSVRVPNPNYQPGVDDRRTVVRKRRVGNTHQQVAGWPQTFRPEGYDWGAPIGCPSY